MVRAQDAAIEITVNGQVHKVQATPDTPVLYVLRNELGLNAAKFGCGLAQCGACTVLRDGQPIRSCVMPVSDVAGTKNHDPRRSGDRRAPASHPAGVSRRTGRPVRVLHSRHDDDGGVTSAAECPSLRGGYPEGAGREPLPVRHARPHHEGDPACRRHISLERCSKVVPEYLSGTPRSCGRWVRRREAGTIDEKRCRRGRNTP